MSPSSRPLRLAGALLALLAPLALLAACDNTTRRTVVDTDASADVSDIADVDTGPSGVGLGCSDERDLTEVSRGCRGGQLCYTSARGFPGGYCTQACLQNPCPADGFCVAEGANRYCLRRCEDDAECRTTEGYVCARPSPLLPRGCVPDPAPKGHRADGSACATGELPRRVFTTDAVSVSHDRTDSLTEAEPSLAISPTDGTVTVAWVGQTAHPDLIAGLSHERTDGSWFIDGTIVDREFNSSINPVIAYGRDGTLYAGYLAQSLDRPQPAVRIAHSADHGEHWSDGTLIAPFGRCAGGCDPPWIAVGRVPGTETDRLHAVYLTRSTRRDAWVTAQHSDDGGAHWSDPVNIGQVVMGATLATEPTYPTVTATADGAVWVAWAMQSRANQRAALGDVHNHVQVAVSRDGGGRFEAPVTLTPMEVPVVSQPPVVAVAEGRAHVLFVAGVADANWSVMVATEPAAGATAWTLRRVNDDMPCATHGFAAMVADAPRRALHVIFEDNRAGEGEVVYARCPLDPTMPCGANERASGAGFHFSTTSDVTRWHGTHAALGLTADGGLRAAWSDTRTGGPAIYVARGTP